MRRYAPFIGIALAAVLVVAIVVSGSRSPVADTSADASPAVSPEHAAAGDSAGMVDAAALEREIETLERAHEANPSSLRIALNLGDAYHLAMRLDEAEACYREALRTHPDHPSAVVRMAMVWHSRGADARAVKAIQEVLQELPDDQEAHYDLGIIFFSMQDVGAARAEWVKAARIDPDSDLGRASQDFVDLLAGQGATPAPVP